MQKNVSLTELAQDWRSEIILSPLGNFFCCSQQLRDRQLIPQAESETLLPSVAASVLKTTHHVRFSQSASNEIHGLVRAFDVSFRVLCVAVLLASPALRRIARNRIEKVRVARVKWLLLRARHSQILTIFTSIEAISLFTSNIYVHKIMQSIFVFTCTKLCCISLCKIHKLDLFIFVYVPCAILMKGGALSGRPGPVDHDRPTGSKHTLEEVIRYNHNKPREGDKCLETGPHQASLLNCSTIHEGAGTKSCTPVNPQPYLHCIFDSGTCTGIDGLLRGNHPYDDLQNILHVCRRGDLSHLPCVGGHQDDGRTFHRSHSATLRRSLWRWRVGVGRGLDQLSYGAKRFMKTPKRGEPLPINQAMNRARTKLGLDLPTWLCISFVVIAVFLAGFRLLAILTFPTLAGGAWLIVRKQPKMFNLWGLSLKQKSYYDPRKF